jgi:DNA mismatch repair protein MutL
VSRIRVLPAEVANQIAAGEVVERPASVVKELVENALDAGASRIEIEIEAGGADRVEVRDDGCGMERDDALLACERHATSKLRHSDDLQAIATFGFRGEALPSIASVARLTLTTSTGGAGGLRLLIDAGRLLESGPAPHPRGTTVRVDALFHNAPARRKFLRTPATEASQIADLIARVGAAHPAIAFRLTSQGREMLAWAAVPSLADRVTQILGADEARMMRPVDHAEGASRVVGLASTPALSRGTPRDEYLYVNARPIRDRRLMHAVHEAYATLLPRGRFPVVFLFLEIPADQVDVNVHPAKAEVRLARAGAIHDLVLRGLRAALGLARPFARLGDRPLAVSEAPRGWEARPPGEGAGFMPASGFAAGPGGTFGLIDPAATPPEPATGRMAPATARDAPPTPELFGPETSLVPLAQYDDTYILAAAAEGLVIVDQHAAHERVLYERLLTDAAAARMERQRLLFPVMLEVPAAATAALEAAGALLDELGFSIAPSGPGMVRVDEVPASVPARAVEALAREALAEILERDGTRAASDLRHRLAASTACHASVRAHEALTLPAMARILADLLRARSPMTCPHGRPTLVRLPLGRLEREFGRS